MSDQNRKRREVTYAGILDEHLLENTVMLDTLTLERLTKALENASKSVKDARPLTRSETAALHQLLTKSKQTERSQVARNISSYAARLDKQEAKIVKNTAGEADSDIENEEELEGEDLQALSLEDMLETLHEEEQTLAQQVADLTEEIETYKTSMTKSAKSLRKHLPDMQSDKDALRQGQRELRTALQGLQQVIVYD